MLSLTGCLNPLGTQKTEMGTSKISENIAGTQSLAVERIVKSAPPPSLEISVPVTSAPVSSRGGVSTVSSNNSVKISIPSQSESTISAQSAGNLAAIGTSSSEFAFSSTLTTGVKLILLAVGLALIFFVVEMIRRRYKAADIFVKKLDDVAVAAEETLSRRINALKERALYTTDASENAKIASELSSLNEERGKLKARLMATKIS